MTDDDTLIRDLLLSTRRFAVVDAVVDEAIRLGARPLWLQLGVVVDAAAARACAAGVIFMQDRSPALEWRRLPLPAGIVT